MTTVCITAEVSGKKTISKAVKQANKRKRGIISINSECINLFAYQNGFTSSTILCK